MTDNLLKRNTGKEGHVVQKLFPCFTRFCNLNGYHIAVLTIKLGGGLLFFLSEVE